MRIYNGICTFNYKQKRLIGKVNITSNCLFPLLIKDVNLPCFSFVIGDENWLWHLQFGHVNFRSLKLLALSKIHVWLPKVTSKSHGSTILRFFHLLPDSTLFA
ncbi:hypothetical protein ACOSQ2_013134 [Xanthoceras sorbifolium]